MDGMLLRWMNDTCMYVCLVISMAPTCQAVDITRSHGDVKVVVTGGGVHLGGVNGTATVQVR